MERINLRFIFPHTDFYQSLLLSKSKKSITYQKDRVLVYLYTDTHQILKVFILNFKFNLTNTKCKVEIFDDGKHKGDEMVYINKNQFNEINLKQKVKKR